MGRLKICLEKGNHRTGEGGGGGSLRFLLRQVRHTDSRTERGTMQNFSYRCQISARFSGACRGGGKGRTDIFFSQGEEYNIRNYLLFAYLFGGNPSLREVYPLKELIDNFNA